MLPNAPARRMVAGALLLFFIVLIPPTIAQAPSPEQGFLGISVQCNRAIAEPAWGSKDVIECFVQDFSRDSLFTQQGGGGRSLQQHMVELAPVVRNVSANVTGWLVQIPESTIFLYGGDRRDFDVEVSATPLISHSDYEFDLVATFTGPAGHKENVTVPLSAQVQLYDFATVSVGNQVQKAGQDQIVVYPVTITNVGVYPDSYRFIVTAPDDFRVAPPPSLYLLPGETKTVNVAVLTPHGKFFEFGKSVSISIKVQSVSGSGFYPMTGSLNVRGFYIPVYWIPLILVGLASAGVVTHSARERASMRRLEAGRPRRVEPTPREAALLAELRQRNREAYAEKVTAMRTVYQERRSDYREHISERRAADREEARKAKIEYVAAKKQRKLDRQREKKEAKAARIAAKKAAKIEKRELKIKEKQLEKKRKQLEKARKKADKIAAKEAKIQAKADAKQAKIDAKQAKADAAAAKKAEKEAKKAAKAAQKRGDGS